LIAYSGFYASSFEDLMLLPKIEQCTGWNSDYKGLATLGHDGARAASRSQMVL